MGAEIDRLELQVEAQATKANGQLDKLVDKMQSLESVLRSVNGNGLSNLADGVSKFAQASTQLSNIKTADFTRLAKNIEKMGAMSSANLGQTASSLLRFANSLSKLDTVNVSDNATQIVTLANGIKQLGYTSATKAIDNIPKLASAMKELMTTLSGVPKVSQNLIDMTNALAKLSRTGASSGRAATSLGRALDTYTASTGRANKGTFSLASAIGKLYAAYWLLFRAFGKIGEAIEISSDLTEVQNVVDVTFGEMAYKVEEFAQTSIEQFGMSELALKQYASRFQAMGSAMVISGSSIGSANSFLNKQTNGYIGLSDSMSDVSLNLTKLTADMASFYNVEQSVVAEDLESIFTGMTRPLRAYGLDLTEATLKEWAMKNGLDANIDSMTQAEKTMLRYQYVLANTGAAQGDFARTADTWANQVRILKQNFQQLASVIGGTFINALKPLVKALNAAMSHIIAFAKTVSNALGKIFGWQYEEGGGGVANDLELGADAADDIAGGMSDAADAAKKMKTYLLGIDELNVLNPDDTDSATGGSGSGSNGSSGAGADGGQWTKVDSIFKDFESELDSLYKLGDYISQTLSRAMESIDWESIYEGARNFGTGLAEFLNGLISPRLFGNVGKTIAGALNTAIYAALSFGETFDFAELGESIAWGINDFFANFDFTALAQTLNVWVDGIKDAIKAFLSTLTWGKIFEGANNFLGTLEIDTVEFLIGAFVVKNTAKNLAGLMASAIASKINFATNPINIPNLLIAFSKISISSPGMIGEIGIGIDQLLQGTFLDTSTWSGLPKKINDAINNLIDTVMQGLGNGIVEIFSTLFNFDQTLALFDGAKFWFDKIKEDFANKDWLSIGKDILLSIIGGFSGAISLIVEPINDLFTAIWDGICELFGIHSPAESMKPLGQNILLGIVQGFLDTVSEFYTAISTWWTESVAPWFTTEQWSILWDNVQLAFSTKWQEIVEWWNGTAIVGWWNNNVAPWFTKEKWTTLYDTIKTSLKTKWDETVTNWKTGITNWWNNDVSPWFTKSKWDTTLSTIKDSFSTAFENAKNTVSSKLSEIYNTVVGWIDAIKSKIAEIGSAFSGIGTASGAVAGIQIAVKGVQGYATGGFPNSADIFYANENGVPELVGTIGHRTAVANGTEITGISDAVYSTGEVQSSLLQTAIGLLQIIAEKDPSINIDGRELVDAYDSRKERNGWAF